MFQVKRGHESSNTIWDQLCRLARLLPCFLLISSAIAENKEVSESASPLSAYESVVESTSRLLEKLKEVQPLFASDTDIFYAEVELALEPYVDFETFAKGVMAKHYRNASPEQRLRFQTVFRQALVKTYAQALVSFDNERVVVLPPQSNEIAEFKSAIVIEIHAKSGTTYQVQYQLGLVDGRWLVRNVIINGINMGLQFRTQFSGLMKRYKGDISELIDNWLVDV